MRHAIAAVLVSVLTSTSGWSQSGERYGIPLNPTQQWKNQQVEMFRDLIHQTIDLIWSKAPDLVLRLDNGEVWGSQILKEKVSQIDFRPKHQMSLINAPGDVSCVSNYSSQWITASDSSTGRATVFFSKEFDVRNFNSEDQRLAFHEAISSIGLVDDEYQVSAPLLSLVIKDQNFSDPKMVRRLLAQVQTRQSAPQKRVGANENCYRWQQGIGKRLNKIDLKQINRRGGVTGVGGGGHQFGPLLKMQLLSHAPTWWKMNSKLPLSSEGYQRFLARINELGIGDLGEMDGAREGYPLEIRFDSSNRRTQVFVFMDQIHESEAMSSFLRKSLDHVFLTSTGQVDEKCFDVLIFGPMHMLNRGYITDSQWEKMLKMDWQLYQKTGIYFKSRRQVKCNFSSRVSR